ncbi:MAG: hypothetical protein PVF34_10210, partial [Gammaproteobacteria bacterium]
MNWPKNINAIGKPTSRTILRLLGAALVATMLYGCGDSVENNPTGGGNNNDDCSSADNPIYCNGYLTNVWQPYLIPNCNGCHQEGGSGVGEFADGDILVANVAAQINNRINQADPANSLMVTKVAGGHQCWVEVNGVPDCAESASRLLAGI